MNQKAVHVAWILLLVAVVIVGCWASGGYRAAVGAAIAYLTVIAATVATGSARWDE